MSAETFFCHLSTSGISEIVKNAKGTICYAGPGIQLAPAQAMADAALRLGPEMLTIWIDFDEKVMRMGYGDIEAIKTLRKAGITVNHAPSLRSAFIIADNSGYIFTPTPLYLEPEPDEEVRNALKLSRDQIAEALARLSPAARVTAIAMAETPEEKERISELPFEGDAAPVEDKQFEKTEKNLEVAPPVKFDLARQVRVFEPYLQYIELSLSGVAIQRHRLAIPPDIQKLGGAKDLEGRLRTTFELIERNSKLSSKKLEDKLNEIRKNLTRSLGKNHGRVVLKAAKLHLEKRLSKFEEMLEKHRTAVEDNLQQHLDKSKKQIIDYYIPIVVNNPPDFLIGQSLTGKVTDEEARQWLEIQLSQVFPVANSLIKNMTLERRYKDITFETLNEKDFLTSVKEAFPNVDWDKAYCEFKAAGETKNK